MSNDKSDSLSLSRRKFLGAAGVVTGGTMAAGLLAVPLSRNEVLDQPYPEIPGNQAILPPNGKHVVIIGGGLSGLQAGVELSARGFRVTILEKTGTPGGKLKSWRDKHFGPEDDPAKLDPSFPGYIREHGIHAVWGFYNNLREFLGRYGWPLLETPEDVSIYNFRDIDGTVSQIPNANWAPPYNKMQLALNAMKLGHLPKKDRFDLLRLFSKLATFDYADQRQREYMDSMTFLAYAQGLGLSHELTYKICDSLLEMAYFDNVDKVSALTLANIFQLVAGSPEDMKVNLYVNPVAESFLLPMTHFIRDHGGEIHYNTEVTDVLMDNGKVKGVKTSSLQEKGLRRCSICGALIVDGMEIGGECPFCGANADMIKVLTATEKSERSFEGDYFINALDSIGAKQFIGRNLPVLGDQPYFSNILKLNSKAVFVCNLWFDGNGYWEPEVVDEAGKPNICFFATGYKKLGITINRALTIRSRTGKHFRWSAEYSGRKVTVIETQIAKAEGLDATSTRDIAFQCYEELKQTMPGLPEPVSWYVNRWHHYTAYHVGDERNRPAVQSPIDNLLFIGDISFVPHPAVFMEKTNVTAKWATNLLLDKIGQQEGKIEILVSGTPSATTDLLEGVGSVYLPATGS